MKNFFEIVSLISAILLMAVVILTVSGNIAITAMIIVPVLTLVGIVLTSKKEDWDVKS